MTGSGIIQEDSILEVLFLNVIVGQQLALRKFLYWRNNASYTKLNAKRVLHREKRVRQPGIEPGAHRWQR
jgi:hypothetical protein